MSWLKTKKEESNSPIKTILLSSEIGLDQDRVEDLSFSLPSFYYYKKNNNNNKSPGKKLVKW